MTGQNLHALRAPFPWYGGKARWIQDVVARLGDISVYAEPFAGSLAVLLGSPPRDREVVCDTDGMVCNAWRAIQRDPELVAYWADYPTFHHDLTARRYWLVGWRDTYAERLSVDMDFFCPKAAGLWVWCLSNWIGASGELLRVHIDKRPLVTWNAVGVQANREVLLSEDKRPRLTDTNGGTGVQAQALRKNLRPYTNTQGGRGVQVQRQFLNSSQMSRVADWNGAQGVQVQRVRLPTGGAHIGDGSRLSDWMFALADRLSRVVVLNRDWSSAVTPTILQHTATGPKPTVGVFLDPPYLPDGRRDYLYPGDSPENNPARAAYQWALDHGELYRIAYCCIEGDFPVPEGWQGVTRTLGGIRNVERRGRQDCVMFSPACRVPEVSEQGQLL